MPKFIKKPVMIEAVKWNGHNYTEILQLTVVDKVSRSISVNPDKTLIIRTLEGNMTANLGDWIIKGIKNEIYPCKPDIFDATYESADPCQKE